MPNKRLKLKPGRARFAGGTSPGQAPPVRTALLTTRAQLNRSVRRNPVKGLLAWSLLLMLLGCAHSRAAWAAVGGGSRGCCVFAPLTGEVILEQLQLLDGDVPSGELRTQLTCMPQFDYPVLAVKAHVQAVLRVDGVIMPDGSVSDLGLTCLLGGVGYGVAEAALRGVAELRFRPRTKENRVGPDRFRATLVFTLH